jgi:MATE family multidrug resistance protein
LRKKDDQYSFFLIKFSKESIDVSWNLLSVALPMTLTQLLNMGSIFVCSLMLSSLSHDVLAASALIFSSQMTTFMLGMSILFSVSFLVGHASGEKKIDHVGQYARQAWLMGIVVFIPMALVLWNIGSILRAVHEPLVLTYIAERCLHGYIIGLLPGCLLMGNLQIFYGTKHAKFALITTCFSVLVLMSVSYLLMFGRLGFPRLGVLGFGLGIASQMTFSFVLTTLILWFHPDFKPYELFNFRKVLPDLSRVRAFTQILSLGWPMTIQFSTELLATMLSAGMVGWIGINELAAFQIVHRYYLLLLVPVFAFSQAMGIVVGRSVGEKNYSRVLLLTNLGLKLIIGLGCFFLVIFLVFSKILAYPYLEFSHGEFGSTLRLTVLLFSVVAFTQLFDGVRNTLTGALRGLFDTRVPMFISIVGIWMVGLPVSYLLAFPLHFGLIGIGLGGLTGILVSMVLVIIRFKYKMNQLLGILTSSPNSSSPALAS